MITIVLPISRSDYRKPVFDCLAALERPRDTELIIITDGDKNLEKSIDRRLDSIHYQRIQVINFGDAPGKDIASRRYRISAIHNILRYYVPDECDYVFSIECDTTYPPDALTKMLKTFEDNPDCMFVQGVELGRHLTKYIGGWIADDVNDPRVIKSVTPSEGITEIDAGGLYCALIDADLYKIHHFQPLDTQVMKGLSCDVEFGLYLRQQGYKCLMDWSIQCDHIGDKGSVNLGNTLPVQVVFEKYNNRWSSRVV